MKIILTYEDLQKIIKDSYNGVNDISIEKDDIEIVLDVDGEKFSKKTIKTEVQLKATTQQFPTKTTEIKPGDTVDFDSRIAMKEIEQEKQKNVVQETHIPLVKTLEEKNAEALKNGTMIKGRNTKRPVKNLG